MQSIAVMSGCQWCDMTAGVGMVPKEQPLKICAGLSEGALKRHCDALLCAMGFEWMGVDWIDRGDLQEKATREDLQVFPCEVEDGAILVKFG